MHFEEIINETIDCLPDLFRLKRWLSQGTFEEECNIPESQFHALLLLNRHRTMHMTQLAEHMMVPRQQLTKVVDALVERGYVHRGADPENRRRILIDLTPYGAAFLDTFFHGERSVLMRFYQSLGEEHEQKLMQAISLLREVFASVQSAAQTSAAAATRG